MSRTEIKELFRCHAPAVRPEPGTGSTGKYHCNHKFINKNFKNSISIFSRDILKKIQTAENYRN